MIGLARLGLILIAVSGGLSACQTTGDYFGEGKKINPASAKNFIHEQYLDWPSFGNLTITDYQKGNYSRTQIKFDAGFINDDAYEMGGFQMLTAERFKDHVMSRFKSAANFGPIKKYKPNSSTPGYYTSIELKGVVCFVLLDNTLERVDLNSGPGTRGRYQIVYCQNERSPNFEDEVLSLFVM